MKSEVSKARRAPVWKSNWFLVVVALICAVLFGMQLWGITIYGDGVNTQVFGTVGGWVSGLASVAAVCVALFFAGRDGRRRDIEKRFADVRARTCVYCWVAKLDDEDDERDGWYLFIMNNTPTSVTRWQVLIESEDSSQQYAILNANCSVPLRPHESSRRLSFSEELGTVSCRIQFIDSVGECWERTMEGALSPLDSIRFDKIDFTSRSAREIRIPFQEPR